MGILLHKAIIDYSIPTVISWSSLNSCLPVEYVCISIEKKKKKFRNSSHLRRNTVGFLQITEERC